jgi:secondary thiamine-phosphate synthase enzyme
VKQAQGELSVATRGKGFYNLTRDAARWLAEQGVREGLLTAFIQHTSASLVIQENADPDVRRDLAEFYERLVPEDTPWFRHTLEGPDDMPSHIRATLTQTHLSIPVRHGTLALGTWQAIYLFEHRAEAQRRSVLLHVIGE